jgi:hypothetical protein
LDQQQQSVVALATPPTEQGGALQHVPEICGFADIAVMKATTAGLIGETHIDGRVYACIQASFRRVHNTILFV